MGHELKQMAAAWITSIAILQDDDISMFSLTITYTTLSCKIYNKNSFPYYMPLHNNMLCTSGVENIEYWNLND